MIVGMDRLQGQRWVTGAAVGVLVFVLGLAVLVGAGIDATWPTLAVGLSAIALTVGIAKKV